MRNGQCPKCGSAEVYSGANLPNKRGSYGVNTIPIKGLFAPSMATLDNYVCINCGYVESYIADPRKLEEIAATWDRITPPESSPK